MRPIVFSHERPANTREANSVVDNRMTDGKKNLLWDLAYVRIRILNLHRTETELACKKLPGTRKIIGVMLTGPHARSYAIE